MITAMRQGLPGCCSAKEVTELDDITVEGLRAGAPTGRNSYTSIPGFDIAFVNPEQNAVGPLRKLGFKRLATYRGAGGSTVFVYGRVNKPVRKPARRKA